MHAGAAQIAVNQQHFFAGLSHCHQQVGGQVALAFALQGAGNQNRRVVIVGQCKIQHRAYVAHVFGHKEVAFFEHRGVFGFFLFAQLEKNIAIVIQYDTVIPGIVFVRGFDIIQSFFVFS